VRRGIPPEALKRRTNVESTSINRLLGVFSPEAEFVLATWMEQGTNRRSPELERELEYMISKLGLDGTYHTLNQAAGAILTNNVIDPAPDAKIETTRPEYLLSVKWESQVLMDETWPEGGTRPLEWYVEYYGVFLAHYSTYFVVREAHDDYIEDLSQWALAAITGKTPSTSELMHIIQRDWKTLSLPEGQLQWEFTVDGGVIDAATAEKLATKVWPDDTVWLTV
jgi:hypothetical protein